MVSHQVGASVVHKLDRNSNLVPVLGLRTLCKISGYTKANSHLPGAHGPLRWGVIRLKPVEFI